MSVFMDIKAIQEYLPHRYPFLLVDRVLECEPESHLVALKNVTMNEPCFTGHFPGEPIMPGVLIVEALAQASGLLAVKTAESRGATFKKGSLFLFAGIEGVRFKRPVVPGDTLTLHIEYLKDKRGIWKFKTEARVGDVVACVGELTSTQRAAE